MRHENTAVDRGSAAHRAGILPGDVLLRINGEDIIDEIDYQALIANRQLEIELERDGKPLHLSEEFPRVCMWEKIKRNCNYQKTHSAKRRGTGRK